jgi:tight adherence protein G
MIKRIAKLVAHRNQDERGAVLIITGLYLVVTVISCALAVDLGGLAQTARQNQKIADLAALDASRALPGNPTTAATSSATRNGYTGALTVECASSSGGPFSTANCTTGTSSYVRVTVASTHSNEFPYVGPGNLVTRKATAAIDGGIAGFSLGSALARVDASVQAPFFGRILENWLGSNTGTITVTALGYSGLAAGTVTLGDLATQLGFGTVNELLAANLTVKQILQATATVLNNHGQAAYADVNTIVGSITAGGTGNTKQISLGNMIKVGSGGDSSAANATVNVLQLISGTAELANKSQFFSVQNAMVNVPVSGIGNIGTTLGVKVIEAPQMYIGPVTTTPTVTTSQLELTFTPTISVGITLPAPVGSLLKAVGTLAVKITGAGAAGTLTTITCSGASKGESVKVDTSAATTTVGTPNPPGTLNLQAVGGLVAATVDVEGSAVGAGNTSTQSFLYPGEFTPSAPSKQTPPGSVVNTTVSNTSAGNVTVGIPPLINVNLAASVVSGAVLTAVKPLLDQIATQMTDVTKMLKEFTGLGVSVAIADVAALRDAWNVTNCGQPGLVH